MFRLEHKDFLCLHVNNANQIYMSGDDVYQITFTF